MIIGNASFPNWERRLMCKQEENGEKTFVTRIYFDAEGITYILTCETKEPNIESFRPVSVEIFEKGLSEEQSKEENLKFAFSEVFSLVKEQLEGQFEHAVLFENA